MKSNRRYTYKNPVQCLPRSHGDLFKDDPSESNNVILPLEPKSWEYGIYLNDGYDYEQHMVSMVDFKDENKELPKVDYEKRLNMREAIPQKLATVINEFELYEGHDIVLTPENDKKMYDELLLEKLRNNVEDELDEDYILGFINAKTAEELSEDDLLPDDLVKILDGETNTSKCDKFMMDRFFDDESVGSMEDEEDNPEESSDKLDFNDGMLDAISKLANLNDYECEPKMKLPDNVSSRSAVSLSFINALERYNQKNKKKDFMIPLSEEDKKYITYEDTEYSEKDIDRACDEWSGRKRKVPKNALANYGKVTGYKPQMYEVPKLFRKKAQDTEKMDTDSVCSRPSVTEIVLPNVSQYHIPRPKDETSEEKKMRKKNIKTAKRQKLETKKEIKDLFTKLSK